MTDPSDLETTGGAAIGTLLRARTDDVHPDLELLTAVSLRSGRRIRARRRIGVAVGLAAGTTAIALIGGQVTASYEGEARDPLVAGRPSAPESLSLAEQDTLVTNLIESVAPGTGPVLQHPRRDGFPTHPVVVIISDQLTKEQKQEISAGLPEGWAASYMSPGPGGLRDEVPIAFSAAEWRCQWYVEDNKGSCRGPNDLAAGVVWRPEANYGKYAGGYDNYFVSSVHDGLFVTIQPAPGTTQADAAALGATMTWSATP